MNAPLLQFPHVGPSEAFRLWSDLQIDLAATTNSKAGFSAETSAIYACIWESWAQWLEGQHDPVLGGAEQRWQQARQQHVQAFLDGPAPKATTRQPKDTSHMADFSRQRYWRVLRDVYAHSVALGLRKDNPALGLPSTPQIARRSRQPQVLPPFVLQLLRDPRRLRELVPQGRVAWLTARDRAAIAVLANCGVTAAEVANLKGNDLRGLLDAEHRQASIPGPPRPEVHLDVAGRSLAVPAAAIPLLLDWLDLRQRVLDQQRAAAVSQARRTGTDPAQAAVDPRDKQPLFLSREAKDGVHVGIEPASLYRVVQRCLRAAYARPEIAAMLEPDAYTAAGPAIIRNTVIKGWIETFGPGKAVDMAGLDELPAF